MRLIAKLERTVTGRMRSLRCTFPKDDRRNAFMREAILKRNLGVRPYAELSFVNNNGETVITYMK